MALMPKLELRQGQQLVMTPQLQQAIRLLQLSNIELCIVRGDASSSAIRCSSATRRRRSQPRARRSQRAEDDDGDGDGERRLEPPRRTPSRSTALRARTDDGQPSACRNGAEPDASAAGRRSGRARSNAFGGEDDQPRGLRRRRPLAGRPPDRAAACGWSPIRPSG